MKQNEITRTKLQSEVIRRAWESVQFRQKLLKEPKEALKEIGFPLHEDIEVTVIQEHKKRLVLVLPEGPLAGAQEYIAGSGIPSQPPSTPPIPTIMCPHTVTACLPGPESPPQQPLPGHEPLPGEEESPESPMTNIAHC